MNPGLNNYLITDATVIAALRNYWHNKSVTLISNDGQTGHDLTTFVQSIIHTNTCRPTKLYSINYEKLLKGHTCTPYI